MECRLEQEAIADVIDGKEFRYILFISLTNADYRLEPLRQTIETILEQLCG